MNMIRPVSDLRNNFADISKTVHETAQPVFLTKNGYGDMVVLSMEAFENLQFESEVYFKLQEAEREAELTEKRYFFQRCAESDESCYWRGNRLYKLEYLPVARKDMLEIVRYISRELQNPGRSGSLGGGADRCSGRCVALSVCNPGLPADPSLEARIQKNFSVQKFI